MLISEKGQCGKTNEVYFGELREFIHHTFSKFPMQENFFAYVDV
jgi:hypothetical protein